jgi:hypothetical protein
MRTSTIEAVNGLLEGCAFVHYADNLYPELYCTKMDVLIIILSKIVCTELLHGRPAAIIFQKSLARRKINLEIELNVRKTSA